jgi:deoxyribonuclease-4
MGPLKEKGKMNEIKFGPAGNPINFFKSKLGKDRLNAPVWCRSIGLNANERQMTYGARMKEEDAIKFGKLAKQNDITLSIHGPYYVVLTSIKQKVVNNSIKELIKTANLAELMSAKRVVFHPGFGDNADKVIKNIKIIEKDKSENVSLLPETMGKLSQLGSLNDVIKICENTECLPCIDFGHLYARSLGKLKAKEDFRKILVEIENRLGYNVLKTMHCHFYPVDFTDKGEKVHRAVTEKNVYPQFMPFGELIKEFNMFPVLISESKDSQDIGALQMKAVMERLMKK